MKNVAKARPNNYCRIQSGASFQLAVHSARKLEAYATYCSAAAKHCRRCIPVAALVAGFVVAALPGWAFAQTIEPDREILMFPGRGVAFSPDGKRIASVGKDRAGKYRLVKVRDAFDGRELLTLNGHSDPIKALAFSPDGKWLASGSYDPSIKIWDTSSGKEIQSIYWDYSQVTDLAFSPDGKRIATVADSRTVVWDIASGKAVLTVKRPQRIYSVAISPDGKWLAAGDHDGTVQLWDALTGRKSRTLKGHNPGAAVRGLSFSRDGKQLADCSVDGTVKLWDVENGQEIRTFKGDGMLADVAFSPDGKRLAAGSHNAHVSEWDIASGRQTLSLKALLDRATAQFVYQIQTPSINYVYDVEYRPDCKQLAAASSDGMVRVWNLKPRP